MKYLLFGELGLLQRTLENLNAYSVRSANFGASPSLGLSDIKLKKPGPGYLEFVNSLGKVDSSVESCRGWSRALLPRQDDHTVCQGKDNINYY